MRKIPVETNLGVILIGGIPDTLKQPFTDTTRLHFELVNEFSRSVHSPPVLLLLVEQ